VKEVAGVEGIGGVRTSFLLGETRMVCEATFAKR